MESFKYRLVVVQLREGSVESDEEAIVDTRMPYIMTDGSNKKCEGIERRQYYRNIASWLADRTVARVVG
jgi:hypothetical protein